MHNLLVRLTIVSVLLAAEQGALRVSRGLRCGLVELAKLAQEMTRIAIATAAAEKDLRSTV